MKKFLIMAMIQKNGNCVRVVENKEANNLEKCRKCGGNCDNGELTGGICPECIEEERKRDLKDDAIRKMLNGSSAQMEFGGLNGLSN